MRGRYVHVALTPAGTELRGQSDAEFGGLAADPDEGVRWRFADGQLELTNDRYGAVPLFYWVGRRELAVAQYLDDLLALGAPAAVNLDAVAAFVRLGFYLGDQTCFASIRAVPPKSKLTWSAGATRIESRPPAAEPVARDRAALVDGFVDRFRAAVARRLPDEEYVLPLSGGRDSRHILLELVRQGAPPRLCVSGAKFPPGDAGDAAVARRVAAEIGLAHWTLPPPRSRLAAELVANAAQSMTTLEGGWTLPLLRFLRRTTRLTYDGIGGDMLSQRLIPRLAPGLRFAAEDPVGTADRLLAAGRFDRYLPGLLGPTAGAALSRARAVEAGAAELRRHAAAASPWTSFFFWNRTRRAVAQTPFGLYGGRPAVHAPFLDKDLFDFLMSMPDGAAGAALHDEVIHRAYPRLAGIPWAVQPSGHGPRYLRHRLGYLADVAVYVSAGHCDWWRASDGLFPRLLRGAGTRHGLRTLNRTLPVAVYLNQLRDRTTVGELW